MATANATPAQARVFLSYSRRDGEVALRLEQAIEARGFEVFIDRHDILPGEDWQARLGALIASADTVVFLLSPDWLASPVCAWEIDEGERLGKRLLPVVIREVAAEQVPGRLRRLNFIHLRAQDPQEAGLQALAAAILTDIAWVREHTRIAELAQRWDTRGRQGRLLGGKDLDEAERWLGARPATAPQPTELQRDFIRAARESATRRRRLLVGSLASGLVLALALAGLAFWQRQVAQDNERRAVASGARTLAELARVETARGDRIRALSLALEAHDQARAAGQDAPEAETAAYEALWRLRLVQQRELDQPLTDAWFSGPAEITVRTAREQRVFDLALQRRASTPRPAADPSAPSDPSAPPPTRPLAAAQAAPPPQAVHTEDGGRTAHVNLPDGSRWSAPQALWGFAADRAWPVMREGPAPQLAAMLLAGGPADETQLAIVIDGALAWKQRAGGADAWRLSPDARLLVLGPFYGPVQLVRVTAPELPVQLQEYTLGQSGLNQQLAFVPGSDLVVWAANSTVAVQQPRLVGVDHGLTVAVLGGHQGALQAVDASADGRWLLTASARGELRLWRTAVAFDAARLRAHRGTLLRRDATVDAAEARASAAGAGRAGGAWGAASAAGAASASAGTGAAPGASFVLAPVDGGVELRHVADGRPLQRFALEGPVVDVQAMPGATPTWAVLTPRHVTVLHADPPRAEPPRALAEAVKPDQARLSGRHVGFCPDADTTACRVRDWQDPTAPALAVDCSEPPRVVQALGVALCPRHASAEPAMVALAAPHIRRSFFPPDVGQALAGLGAGQWVEPVPGCRRGLVNVYGLNADVPWNGENVLVDFATGRELARDRGDGGATYEPRDGELAVFCSADDLFAHVRELLKAVRGTAR